MATPAADRGRRDAPPPVGLTWAWDRSPPAPLPAAGAAPASGSPPSLPAAATPSSVARRSTGSACTARPASASAPPFPRSPLLRNNTAQSAPRPATHTAAAHSTSLPPDRSANDAAQSASPDCFLPLQIHLQPAGLFVHLLGQRSLASPRFPPPVREDPILLKRSPTCWATPPPRPPTATPRSRWPACEAWPSPRRRGSDERLTSKFLPRIHLAIGPKEI